MGYGATCGRHVDAGKAVKTPCKKAVTFVDELTPDMCIIRLKRWLVAGLTDEHSWGDSARKQHVMLGGQGLRAFAGGLSDAQLDARVGALAPGVGAAERSAPGPGDLG